MPEPPSWAPFLSLGWSRPQCIEGGKCVEGTSIMMMMTTVQGVTLGTPPPLLGSTAFNAEQSCISLLGLP